MTAVLVGHMFKVLPLRARRFLMFILAGLQDLVFINFWLGGDGHPRLRGPVWGSTATFSQMV